MADTILDMETDSPALSGTHSISYLHLLQGQAISSLIVTWYPGLDKGPQKVSARAQAK